MGSVANYGKIFAYQSESVDDTTLKTLLLMGFTAEQIKEADSALISVEGAAIRWRADGVADVTAAEGHPELEDRAFTILGGANLNNLQIIAQTGTATVRVSLAKTS